MSGLKENTEYVVYKRIIVLMSIMEVQQLQQVGKKLFVLRRLMRTQRMLMLEMR